jgi:peptide/nickel transport system permease protein
MARTLAWRLILAVPTLVIVTLGVFLLFALAPGDPAREIAGQDATPETLASIRQQLRLDDPLPVRYGKWVADLMRGDLGKSFVGRQPVMQTVLKVLPVSLSLVLVAMVMATAGALVLGVLPELVSGRGMVSKASTAISALMLSIPNFWLALILVSAFAVDRSWLPAVGYVSFRQSPWQWLQHLLIPAASLAAVTSAELGRQLRSSLRAALDTDYVLAARAKGLSNNRIVLKHGLKNGAIPVVTVLGVRVGQLIGATAIIEQIFIINGLGSLAVTAVLQRDIPVVLGVVTISTAIILIMNILVDVAYLYFNPRLRAA